MDKEELRVLQTLDAVVGQTHVRTTINSMALRVEEKLAGNSGDLLAYEPVPLTAYGRRLPDMIRSSWVFAIRARASTGAERHPNSHQRMMSYFGSGDLQIWTGERWRSNTLTSDSESPLESRWVSIPPGIWHQAVAPEDNWIVVSFHTAPENMLMEERPDANDAGLIRQRRYMEN